MTDRLSIVRRRLHHQRLAGDPLPTPAAVVGWLGAVQAQEYAEANWSLGMRMQSAHAADVEAAFDRGEILRTHVLRPTWHFVTPADIRWLLRLTAPRVHAQNRSAYRAYEVDPILCGRARRVIAGALADTQPLTRAELVDRLAAEGIAAAGPRLAHILMDAELEQVICSGPRRGRQHTYVLLDTLAPTGPELTREQGLSRLAARYFTSHGPAGVHDFGWWANLTLADARLGLGLAGGGLREEQGDDGTLRYSAADSPAAPPGSGVLLIPTYDESVIAYKEPREVFADDPTRNGRLGRGILLDGCLVGSWKRTLSARNVVVEATVWQRLRDGELRALEGAMATYGRFLGQPAELVLATPTR